MRALTAVLAVVLTLLLGVIAVELHQINQHLSWVSGPIQGLAAIGRESIAQSKTETREERIARRVAAMRESNDETAEVISRVLTGKPLSAYATKPTSQTQGRPKAPRP